MKNYEVTVYSKTFHKHIWEHSCMRGKNTENIKKNLVKWYDPLFHEFEIEELK